MSCCETGLTDIFTPAVSRKDADRYRRKGLPPRARKLVRAIESRTAITDRTVLEIGSGAGALLVDLMRRGARAGTGVDAVPSQIESARRLAADFDVANRISLVLADFARNSDVASADVVILDRVVCCYPEWQPLLAAAASRSTVVLAMTYPRAVWWMRLLAAGMNLSRWLLRSEFRFYIHSRPEMQRLLEKHGLAPRVEARYWAWEIMTATAVA